MYFSPFIHEHDNHLAILSQWSITLIVIAAMVIKVEAISSNNENDKGLGAVLIFLNILIVVFAIITAFANSKEGGEDDKKGIFGEEIEIDEDEDDSDNKSRRGSKRPSQRKSGDREVDSDVGSDSNSEKGSYDSDDEQTNHNAFEKEQEGTSEEQVRVISRHYFRSFFS